MSAPPFDQESLDRFGRFLGRYMQRIFLPGLIGAVVLGFISQSLGRSPGAQRVLERLAFDGGGLLLASWLGLVGLGCLWLTLRRARLLVREPGWSTAARTLFLALCGLGLVALAAGFARASGLKLWSLLT